MEGRETRSKSGRQRSSARQFVAFLVVGGGAALAYVLLSSVIVSLRTGVADWIVSSACYAAMVVPVYLAHRGISFRSQTAHRVALPRYVTVQAIGLSLAAAVSYATFNVLHLPAVAASSVVVVLVSIMNFLLLRLWAFRN